MKKPRSQFGRIVRSRRRELKITLGELARGVGWSASYLSDIELGKRRPPKHEDLVRLAELLELGDHTSEQLFKEAVLARGSVRIQSKSVKVMELARALERGGDRLSSEALDRMLELATGRREKDED